MDPPTLASETMASMNHTTHGWAGDPHRFAAVPYVAHVAMGAILAAAILAGCVANVLVVANSIRHLRVSPRRPSFHLFVLNLAASNLVPAVTAFPMAVASAFSGYWVLGHSACVCYSLVVGCAGLSAITTMALISIDHFSVITNNLDNSHIFFNKTRAVSAVAGTWLYGLLWTCPPLFGYGSYTLDGFGTSCSFHYTAPDLFTRSFVLLLFLAGFCAPLFVNAACYCFLFSVVRRHKMELHRDLRTHQRGGLVMPASDRRIWHLSLAVIVVFCLAWMPYAIIGLMGVAGQHRLITPTASAVCGLFAKVTTLFTPFIYTSMRRPAAAPPPLWSPPPGGLREAGTGGGVRHGLIHKMSNLSTDSSAR